MKQKIKRIHILKPVLVIAAVLVLICSSSSGIANNKSTTQLTGNLSDIIHVGGSGPGNYSTIQEGIAASTDGDTVYVYDGIYTLTYPVNIIIDKEVTLQGQSQENTIILMNDTWPSSIPDSIFPVMIIVEADNVTVESISLWFTASSSVLVADGLLFNGTSHCMVYDCYVGPALDGHTPITHLRKGIFFAAGDTETTGNSVIDCEVIRTNARGARYPEASGMSFIKSSNVVISGCFSDLYDMKSIFLQDTSDAVITNCEIYGRMYFDDVQGLNIHSCYSRPVEDSWPGYYYYGNAIEAIGGVEDFTIDSCEFETFLSDVIRIIGTSVSTLEILNCSIHDVNAHGLVITKGADILIEECKIKDANRAIYLTTADTLENIDIINCELFDNLCGIKATSALNNVGIIDCDIHDNNIGISLGSLRDSLILNNHIYNHGAKGLELGTLTGETPTANEIHHNSYSNNTEHATFTPSVNQNNRWDDGYEGNYWGDYEEKYPDATNNGVIWDTPYEIMDDSRIFDRYPLVSWKPAAARVNVLNPTGEEEVPYGPTVMIEYTVFNFITDEPLPDAEITIQYNIDNGEWIDIASDIQNTGEYEWEIADNTLEDSESYRIRVLAEYQGTTGYDKTVKFAIDGTPPSIEFVRPIKGDVIVFNMKLITLSGSDQAIAIGSFLANAEVQDNMSGVNNTVFSLGDFSSEPIYTPPYLWEVADRGFGSKVFSVTAMDNAGRTATAELPLFYINLLAQPLSE